jgi:hypothetical protein
MPQKILLPHGTIFSPKAVNNGCALDPLGGKRGAEAATPDGARGVLAHIPFSPSPGRMETRFRRTLASHQ